MPLPASFQREGFTRPAANRGVLIGTEGGANTGKSRFIMTGPGPGIVHAIDRSYRAMLESGGVPEGSDENFLFLPTDAPLYLGIDQVAAAKLFNEWYINKYLTSLKNVDAKTIGIDGNSAVFDWQMLAQFGRTEKIPQIQRTALNAAHRLFIARAWSSGKICIMTHTLKKSYENVWNPDGSPVMDPQRPQEQLRQWDGRSWERQGFNDHEYLYEIQLRHLFRNTEKRGQEWGFRILMCKSNRGLEGSEVWGEDCNIQYLLENAYPHVHPKEWGYR